MKKISFLLFISLFLLSACTQQSETPPKSNTSLPETQTQDSKPMNISVLPPSQATTEESTTLTQQTSEVSEITEEEVSYFPGHDQVKGFLARPKDGQNLPAIILIHEWWGLNKNMHDLARKFAQQGYVALAVDLYEGKSTKDSDEAKKLATAVRENMDPAFDNLKAAITYLKSSKQVSKDRVASIGWCFGGGWAYQMAKNDMGVKASIMYYGQFSPKDDLHHMKTTILGHFGEKDTSIKVDNVREFQATLKTLSGNHEVYIYPNAGHGFTNPDNPSYDPVAAELAWKRTMEFLKKYL